MRQPSLPSTTAPATSGTLQTRPLGSQLQRVFRPRTTSECNAGLPRRTRPRRGTVETAIRSRVRDEEMWTEVRAHGSVELVTVDGFSGPHSKLLLFLPGMDGTGLAIRAHAARLAEAGFAVRALRIAASDRSGWDALVDRTAKLVRAEVALLQPSEVVCVGESFGAVLALKVSLRDRGLFDRLVLVNPATSFRQSLGGLPSLVAGTGLLGAFTDELFSLAQGALLPLLVDQSRVDHDARDMLQRMMSMDAGAGTSSSSMRVAMAMGAQSVPSGAAGAAAWRLRLLQSATVSDAELATVAHPTLIVASACDRLFPSLAESSRLVRAMPQCTRHILSNSAHAPLLERGVDLAAILDAWRFVPEKEAMPALRAASTSVSAPSTTGRGTRASSPVAGGGMGLATRGAWHTGSGTAGRRARGDAAVASAGVDRGAGPGDVERGVNGAVAGGGVASDEVQVSRAKAEGGSRVRQTGAGQPRYEGLTGVPRATEADWAQWESILGPLRLAADPVVLGEEHLPRLAPGGGRGVLFVGNHTLFGFYDAPLLVLEMHRRGTDLRSVAHPGHWLGPLGPLFEKFGAVPASATNLARLLKAREAVLLFPGGAREVNKRKGEEYRLFWSEQPGLIRLAARTNAVIVPFAALGGDEAFELGMDTSEILENPLTGPLVQSVYERLFPDLAKSLDEVVPPLTRLRGTPLLTPVPVPSPKRLYFTFRPPIDPLALGAARDPSRCAAAYQAVQESIYAGVEELKAYRAADPESELVPRLLSRAVPFWPRR